MGILLLISSAERCNPTHDPIMVFIVASSIFNAVAYTGGPFPLGYIHASLGSISIGYSGLGDLFVFLYFGVVATMGVPYLYLTKIECFDITSAILDKSNLPDSNLLQLQSLQKIFIHSISIGFLATGIIVVNNLRDRYTVSLLEFKAST